MESEEKINSLEFQENKYNEGKPVKEKKKREPWKIKIPSELAFIIAEILMALAVAMQSQADFGLSMIVAPANILHLKMVELGLDWFTFGLGEYVVQGVLFILLCIIIRKFKPLFLFSFISGIVYGLILDGFRLIPAFNPNVVSPDTIDLGLKIFYFIAGTILTTFSVAILFKVYIYPQVYDFFVVAIVQRYHLKQGIFKWIFDGSMLVISVLLSFILFGFGMPKSLGIGTIIMVVTNGPLIALFTKIFNKHLEIKPLAERLSRKFRINA